MEHIFTISNPQTTPKYNLSEKISSTTKYFFAFAFKDYVNHLNHQDPILLHEIKEIFNSGTTDNSEIIK